MDTRTTGTVDRLPRCILLNGTSSSGKTSLARALQERLPIVYLNFSIDSVLYALPPSDLRAMIEGRRIERGEYDYDRLVRGFHAAIAGLLASDNRLIVDNALTQPVWKVDFDAAVAGYDTLRIGVTCEPDEARRREYERGDRAIGTVDWELPRVHVDIRYDLMIDTTGSKAEELAGHVVRRLARQET